MIAIGIVVSCTALGDRKLSSSGGQGTRHLLAAPVPDDEDEAFVSIGPSALDAEIGQVKPAVSCFSDFKLTHHSAFPLLSFHLFRPLEPINGSSLMFKPIARLAGTFAPVGIGPGLLRHSRLGGRRLRDFIAPRRFRLAQRLEVDAVFLIRRCSTGRLGRIRRLIRDRFDQCLRGGRIASVNRVRAVRRTGRRRLSGSDRFQFPVRTKPFFLRNSRRIRGVTVKCCVWLS